MKPTDVRPQDRAGTEGGGTRVLNGKASRIFEPAAGQNPARHKTDANDQAPIIGCGRAPIVRPTHGDFQMTRSGITKFYTTMSHTQNLNNIRSEPR
jgi:hypothetical protein